MRDKIEEEITQIQVTLYELTFEVECIDNEKSLDNILESLKRVESDVGDIFGFAQKQSDKEFANKENDYEKR